MYHEDGLVDGQPYILLSHASKDPSFVRKICCRGRQGKPRKRNALPGGIHDNGGAIHMRHVHLLYGSGGFVSIFTLKIYAASSVWPMLLVRQVVIRLTNMLVLLCVM